MEDINMDKLKKIFESTIPKKFQLPIRFFYHFFLKHLDYEMFYVNKILKKRRRFIDIGSNVGLWTYFFTNKFKYIEAFEPFQNISFRINLLDSNKTKINLYNCGLSNRTNKQKIYIPMMNDVLVHSAASFNKLETKTKSILIDLNKLDNYHFNDVDLIKIDVEGYESNVIDGAKKTIMKFKPIIVAEIEQRHLKNMKIEVVIKKNHQFGLRRLFF